MTTQLSAIPWHEVVAVGIRTTAKGPFCEDLFWEFLLPDRCLEVMGALIDDEAFDVLRKHLPGLDWTKALRALSSTEERIFRVWHREESRFAPSREELAARYGGLVERLGGNAGAAMPAFDRVYGAWSADSRRYHGPDHLVDCLRELDTANVSAVSANLVELALWYHDVVYEPGAANSEERSAQTLLADASILGIPSDVACVVAELVRATAHVDGPSRSTTAELDLVLDIDLSVLGRDVLCFMDFEYGVEEEYAHVSRLLFRRARGRFLASLLGRARLFRTETFYERYEQRARVQLGALLASPRYRAYRWLRWLPLRR